MSEHPPMQTFQRNRWGKTRKMMDAMNPGDYLMFPLANRNSVVTTVARFNYAWGGQRRFSCKTMPTYIQVQRTS